MIENNKCIKYTKPVSFSFPECLFILVVHDRAGLPGPGSRTAGRPGAANQRNVAR